MGRDRVQDEREEEDVQNQARREEYQEGWGGQAYVEYQVQGMDKKSGHLQGRETGGECVSRERSKDRQIVQGRTWQWGQEEDEESRQTGGGGSGQGEWKRREREEEGNSWEKTSSLQREGERSWRETSLA